MSSRGGYCGVANDSFISLVTNRSGRIVHYIVGVRGSLTTRYDGHSRVTGGGPGQSVVMDTPKDLLVACCEINHASLTNYHLTRPGNVNGTRPETHTRMIFVSSLQYYPALDYQMISILWTSVTL